MNFNNDNKDTAAILEANERIRDEMSALRRVCFPSACAMFCHKKCDSANCVESWSARRAPSGHCAWLAPCPHRQEGFLPRSCKLSKSACGTCFSMKTPLFSLHNQRQEHYKERCKLLDRSSSELQQKRIELEGGAFAPPSGC